MVKSFNKRATKVALCEKHVWFIVKVETGPLYETCKIY